MFIDDITIRVRGGDGGRGAVSFNKNLHQFGPVGGSGGNGGNFYFEGSTNFNLLSAYSFKKEFCAQNGKNGRGQFRDGASADDLVLPVPVGTIIHNLTIGVDHEVVRKGERILIAKGGKGGRGNFHFRSSTNRSPRQFEQGESGESFAIRLELKLIADVGLIGLPNVGKSSLLNELTNAKSKVANYLFTTLQPNLGVYHDLILADIPGLIEGASGGKGLGTKFLRHIERTHILFHIISAESGTPLKDYRSIRKELGSHNKELLKKKEFIFLGKSDMISASDLKKKITSLKKINTSVSVFSIYDFESIEKIKKILNTIEKEKNE